MRVKREPLSLNILPEAKLALLERADREGHRYPSVFAATLLERAVMGGQGGGGHVVSDPACDAFVKAAPAPLPNHKVDGGPGLADTLSYVQDEMVDIAKQARAGELDVEYLYREIERWAAEIARVRGGQ